MRHSPSPHVRKTALGAGSVLTLGHYLGAVIACLLVLVAVLSISRQSGTRKVSEQQNTVSIPTTAGEGATAQNAKAVNMKQQLLLDAQRTARENYIDRLRQNYQHSGVDASVSDINGELTIASDALKLKSDRDYLIRQQFGPKVRHNLCSIGFKTLALKSGVILGDSDEYSLGCPEAKTEREVRLREEESKRRDFVANLQNTFSSDPQGSGIQVTQGKNEIILTGASFADLSPEMIRGIWASKFSDDAQQNLCELGFRSLRARANRNARGAFISFHCEGREPAH